MTGPIQDTGPCDADLMRQVADGKMNALAELVHRHQDSVRALAYRMLHRWDLADDVAQETFLRLYRSAQHYRATAAFKTYLYRIAANLCIDRCRQPRLAPLDADQDPPVAGAEEDVLRRERNAAVHAAIAKLPPRQKLALILHRFEGLSHTQIAESMECSESAVESLLTRAYTELRQRLAQWSTP